MEKIDILGLAILVLGVFTFLNILAMSTIFKMIEFIRKQLSNITSCINENSTIQSEINSDQHNTNIKLTNHIGEVINLVRLLLENMNNNNNNTNSPSSTGGQEKSN